MDDEDNTSETLSRIYHALRAPRRRYVIHLLTESDQEEVSVRFLSRCITAIEHDISTEHATGEPYRNVYNALSQTHLDTLSDANLIIYESNRQTVAPGPDIQFARLIMALNRATYRTLHGLSPPAWENLEL